MMPVTSVSTSSNDTAGRSSRALDASGAARTALCGGEGAGGTGLSGIGLAPSDEVRRGQQQVDQLDADERHDDAAEPIDEEIAPQQYRRTEGPVAHPLERQR